MKFLSITKKDLKLELRDKQTFNFMFLFSLITLMLFSYTLSFKELSVISPQLLWFIFLFSAMLSLSKSFLREKEWGTLEGLKLAPIKETSILAGKIIFNLILLYTIQMIIFPLSVIIFNIHLKSLLTPLLVLTLGNLGLAIIGSTFSSFTLKSKVKELILPITFLPVSFPFLTISTIALEKSFLGQQITKEILLMSIYIIAVATISLSTFSYLMED